MGPNAAVTPVSFHDAAARLRAFLRSKGRPEAIVWINSADILTSGAKLYVQVRHPDRRWMDAQCRYENAMERNRGVVLEQVCEAPGLSCCRVHVPNGAPAGDLQFTCGEKARRAIPVTNRLYWRWLRMMNRKQ